MDLELAERSVVWFERKSTDRLDFELQTRVTDYLCHRDELAFRSLQIEVDHGTVTLTGRVRTYYEKQVAMSCVNVVGVLSLIDNLTVPEWDSQRSEFPFTL